MNRPKLLTFTIFTSVLLLAGISTGAEDPQFQPKSGPKIKTIHLDPAYGGKEKGPVIGGKQYGKDITLKIAQELQSLLQNQGHNVILSRTGDQFVTPDQRTVQAKSNRADILISIKVSSRKTDCVRAFIAHRAETEIPESRLEGRSLKDLDVEITQIIEDLKDASRYEESLQLAAQLSEKMKKAEVSRCNQLMRTNNYILQNASVPSVMIDFGVSKTSKSPYLLDSAIMDKITRSLAHGIAGYVNDRNAPAPVRK